MPVATLNFSNWKAAEESVSIDRYVPSCAFRVLVSRALGPYSQEGCGRVLHQHECPLQKGIFRWECRALGFQPYIPNLPESLFKEPFLAAPEPGAVRMPVQTWW